MEINAEDITKKRILTYLSIVFGILHIPWIIGIIIPNLGDTIYTIISFPVVFMGTPALAVFITRKMTKDTTKLHFSTKIFKNKKALLFSTLLPGAAVFLGTVLFFLIFPDDLDFHSSYISETYGAFGAPYTGVFMMVFVTIVLGIWMSYITLKTKNCMYAAIIHGAVDIIGEAGVWISLSTRSSLLGPIPSGIIGLSVLLIEAVILFVKMPCDEILI
ncbi:MAG: hypothetical protein K2N98_01390 [Lachnospiraceae bacterium]|nr:hypothetical protein [Lachnospiraceae bacterium]